MDDMYQYAASAVNSNNKEQASSSQQTQEENDVILKAFNNIGWGQKWSSLVDTVKKQSEAFVEGTRKDLQEIAQVLTEDAEEEEEEQVQTREATSTTSETEHTALDTIRDNLSKINTVNFVSLREGLTHTLNQSLPSQMTQVRLPENMDLTQLKEGLAKNTRSAEHYLQNFGTEVISALKNTVTVLAPEEEEEAIVEERRSMDSSKRVYATRKDALLAKMQNNEDTYLQEPELDEQEKKLLDTFNSTFHIDEYTDEIAQLLDTYPHLRDMMDRLVPVQISYTLFWQRYFYHAWKIDQDEQKRQLIVQNVQKDQQDDEEADFKWDSDDEDNATVKQCDTTNNSKSRSSTTNSDDTDDFSHISDEPTSSTASVNDWIKAEKKKSDEECDSDSDWE